MNNKKAFSLGELLMVFVIVGVIATIGMTTTKPWQKAYKHAYARIYNALSVAIYNYMSTVSGTDSFPETPAAFCNALVTYINTSNDASHSSSNPCDLTGGKDDFLTDTPAESDFAKNGQNPKIKLSNGAYLWIGAKDKKEPFKYEQTISDSKDVVRYYLVYADLNGNRGPNRAVADVSRPQKQLPDVVAFAVTDNFTVIPLGYPKVDQRYLSANIVYPPTEEYSTGPDDNTNDDTLYSDSMTYYEAIVGAYGKSPDKIITQGIIFTYDLEEALSDNNIFKMVGDDLEEQYVNKPTFDSNMCGNGQNARTIINDDGDSLCDIKIFNYQ